MKVYLCTAGCYDDVGTFAVCTSLERAKFLCSVAENGNPPVEMELDEAFPLVDGHEGDRHWTGYFNIETGETIVNHTWPIGGEDGVTFLGVKPVKYLRVHFWAKDADAAREDFALRVKRYRDGLDTYPEVL